MLVPLPSTAQFELNLITGKTLVKLAEAAAKNPNDRTSSIVMGEFFAACFARVVEPGPYPYEVGDTFVDFRRVLRADLFWAFINVAAASRPEGAVYPFDFSCRKCSEVVPWQFDALRDLKLRMLSPVGVETMRNNRPFYCEVPGNDGQPLRVGFHLPKPTHETWLQGWLKQQKRRKAALPDLLFSRMSSIGDIPQEQFRRKGWDLLCDLPMASLEALDAAFDKEDCGFATRITVKCPECGEVQKVEVPLDLLRMARKHTQDSDETSGGSLEQNLPDPNGYEVDTARSSGEDNLPEPLL